MPLQYETKRRENELPLFKSLNGWDMLIKRAQQQQNMLSALQERSTFEQRDERYTFKEKIATQEMCDKLDRMRELLDGSMKEHSQNTKVEGETLQFIGENISWNMFEPQMSVESERDKVQSDRGTQSDLQREEQIHDDQPDELVDEFVKLLVKLQIASDPTNQINDKQKQRNEQNHQVMVSDRESRRKDLDHDRDVGIHQRHIGQSEVIDKRPLMKLVLEQVEASDHRVLLPTEMEQHSEEMNKLEILKSIERLKKDMPKYETQNGIGSNHSPFDWLKKQSERLKDLKLKVSEVASTSNGDHDLDNQKLDELQQELLDEDSSVKMVRKREELSSRGRNQMYQNWRCCRLSLEQRSSWRYDKKIKHWRSRFQDWQSRACCWQDISQVEHVDQRRRRKSLLKMSTCSHEGTPAFEDFRWRCRHLL